MRSHLAIVAGILLTTLQTHAAELRFAGTFGQQRVRVLLRVEGESVADASYCYETQKEDVRIVSSRVFGTTAVLQDEDGNVLHLHFRKGDDSPAADLDHALLLQGTLERGELDLPVALRRVD